MQQVAGLSFHFKQIHTDAHIGSGRSILRSNLQRLSPAGTAKGSSVLNSVLASHRFMGRRNRNTEHALTLADTEIETKAQAKMGLPANWHITTGMLRLRMYPTASVIISRRGLYRHHTNRLHAVATPVPTAVQTVPLLGATVCGHALVHNDRYQILGGWCYELDAANRVTRASSPGPILILGPTGETRNHHITVRWFFSAGSAQRRRGHIRAKRLGGSAYPLNLVPQHAETNRVCNIVCRHSAVAV